MTPVDEYLLNQVVKHVDPEELDSMARDLFVDETVYEGIKNPKNRVYKVIPCFLSEYSDVCIQFVYNYCLIRCIPQSKIYKKQEN